MLGIQIFALIGRAGVLDHTETSPFGCIVAPLFLAEYILFVPSLFICSVWMFRAGSIWNTNSWLTVPLMSPPTDIQSPYTSTEGFGIE